MYCGDETGAFVGEISSHTSKFGYGGEDNPKYVIPSYQYQYHPSRGGGNVPISSLRCPSHRHAHDDDDDGSGGDIVSVYPQPNFVVNTTTNATTASNNNGGSTTDPNAWLQGDGIIQNWDVYENLWDKAFHVLRVRDPYKHTRGGAAAAAAATTTAATSEDKSGGAAGAGGSSSNKCAHPILAIDSGHTHLLPSLSSNSSSEPDITTRPFGQSYQTTLHRDQHIRMTELLFERFDAPSVFVAPSPMLMAFAYGRQTCLVVDVGGHGTRVTPVVDGLLLRNAQRRSGRGGEWLSEVQCRVLEDIIMKKKKKQKQQKGSVSVGIEGEWRVRPRYTLNKKKTKKKGDDERTTEENQKKDEKDENKSKTTLFHRWAIRDDVMYEMKTSPHVQLSSYPEDTSVPFVHKDKGEDEDDNSGSPMDTDEEEKPSDDDADAMKYYELPDGTRIDLVKTKCGRDLCRLPELLFTDEIPFMAISAPQASMSASASSVTEQTLSSLPLHKLVHASLSAVTDADARKELCGNIILTGASSLFPNMESRLSYEISNIVPSTYKCRVVASRNTMERRYAAWIGGSVLTSLGSFQQLWLSRAEYDEYGATLGVQRFP